MADMRPLKKPRTNSQASGTSGDSNDTPRHASDEADLIAGAELMSSPNSIDLRPEPQMIIQMKLEGSVPKIMVDYGFVWWKASELLAADREKVAGCMQGRSSDWIPRHLKPSPRKMFPGKPVILGCQDSALFDNELYFRVCVACWVEMKDIEDCQRAIWTLLQKYEVGMDWRKFLGCDSELSGSSADGTKTAEASEVD